MKNKTIIISAIFVITAGLTVLAVFLFLGKPVTVNKNFSDTKEVSGVIIQSQTWSGIVTVKGDVFAAPWVTLTILPGTKVLFEKNPDPDLSGAEWTKWADAYIKNHKDPTGKKGYADSHFEIAAKIIAIGTKEKPIIFTSAQAKKEYADWDQLVLFTGSRLENVELSFAHNGVNIEGKGVTIKNSKIHDSLWSCIDIFSTDNVIEGNEIYHCWHQAIGIKVTGKNIIQNNYIHDAWLSVNCEYGANPEVKNNIFKSAPYNTDCPAGQSNEIIKTASDTNGGTYNGVLVYPANVD